MQSKPQTAEKPKKKKKNDPNKPLNKLLGAFNGMGLSRIVQRGIGKAGYRDATPIQRKAIPVLLEGRDIVAMARTGSGKSAAFIIPLLERLSKPRPNIGNCVGTAAGPTAIRALIFSPTRELALQTTKFIKTLGHFCKDLTVITTLGGDSMEEQFSAIHDGPDIVVATPGRFLHLCVEMSLKLSNVEYVVFDEADRLFELGLGEQISEIIARLPEHRQTALFSATLPQMLADFANVGLNNPTLIRLDVESTLSDKLTTSYLAVRSQDKYAACLYLLRHHISQDSMTAIFLPTRHHVEYLKEVLERADIASTHVYSALDAEARKVNISRFQKKNCRVLLVTDVAARGIDIPLLDVVINFNFPHKPKLFVHRVGRVARANRDGTAYSLVSTDELPYLHDLHIFLGKPINFAPQRTDPSAVGEGSKSNQDETAGLFGSFPQDLLDEQNELIERWKSMEVELAGLFKVANNAMQQYGKSIGAPSAESARAMKAFAKMDLARHPMFYGSVTIGEVPVAVSAANYERENLLTAIKNYKPTSTIFEIGEMKKSKHIAYATMNRKREAHDKVLAKKLRQTADDSSNLQRNSNKEEIAKDEHYLPYEAADHHKEKGLGLERSLNAISGSNALTGAVLDIYSDDVSQLRAKKTALKWDRKKKKFTHQVDHEKKIKTESGAKISASYKSDLYKKWKAGYKIDDDALAAEGEIDVGGGDDSGGAPKNRKRRPGKFGGPKNKRGPAAAAGPSPTDGEKNKRALGTAGLKPKDQILKNRLRKEQKMKHEKWRQRENEAKRVKSGKGKASQAGNSGGGSGGGGGSAKGKRKAKR